MSKPLTPVSKLASNPTDPTYGTTLEINGEQHLLSDPKANRALTILMNQQAVNGGAAAHWGGPSAFAEIMSVVHYKMFQKAPWYDHFHFVNDAGHTENGVYALRANYQFDQMNLESLKGFRSISSKFTGHGEAHLNPEGVFISNGPLGSGLPQAQGLAMADKLSGNSRVSICTISDGASMEGEAKEAFSAIPGLAKKGKLNPFLLIVSDNNTKLSGRIDQDAFDMGPTFNALESLGWDTTYIEKGNDLEAVYQAVDQALSKLENQSDRPVALVFKTVKGFGVKSTEESASGGHGYPLKGYDPKVLDLVTEVYAGEAVPSEFETWAKDLAVKPEASSSSSPTVPKEKIQVGIAKAAIEARQAGYPVVSLSSDLQGSTGIAPFHKEFPEASFDLGVAESNMVSSAAGMSKLGYIPLVDTFAQFGVTKGNLPLTMANLSQAPVICLFSHTGFQDAADGASHQATAYIAAVASIPHVDVINCSCSEEAYHLLSQSIKRFHESREKGEIPNSVVFFLGRETFPRFYSENQSYDLGAPQLLESGEHATLVVSGSMVPEALKLNTLLKDSGKSVSVVNLPHVNRSSLNLIQDQLQKTAGNLITLEDHQIRGGMGSIISHQLLEAGTSFKLKSFGIKESFGQSAYSALELYEKHAMDAKTISRWIQENL